MSFHHGYCAEFGPAHRRSDSKRDFSLQKARAPSATSSPARVAAPLLTQLIYGTTSAIHPNAQCKRSQPYHQSDAWARLFGPRIDEYVHGGNTHYIAQGHIQADPLMRESNDPNTRILLISRSVPHSNWLRKKLSVNSFILHRRFSRSVQCSCSDIVFLARSHPHYP